MKEDVGSVELSDAQRRYLTELEPNRVDRTATALIRKGIVKPLPHPCECGWHYVSLTQLGERIRASITKGTSR